MTTFGKFVIEVEGEPVRFASKAKRKPLLLLKALVALGGEGVKTEILTDSLWQDSEGDNAYNALNQSLSNLRGIIGKSAVTLSEGRVSLVPDRVWVDVRAFVAAAEQATRALLDGQGDVANRQIEQALELYKGRFLEGEFEPNEIAAERERLHAIFLRCLEEVCKFHQDSGDPAAAMRLFQRGLERDIAAEQLYRGLMTCQREQGRFAEALAAYERCRAVLKGQWEVEPAPETEALRQAIEADARAARSAVPQPTPEVPPPPPDVNKPAEPGVSDDGQRRRVTVVMLDIVGYTALTEALDPEDLNAILERVKGAAHSVIEAQGGIVNQFVGDEVVALFGYPQAQEDDARRAVQAALNLHEAISEIGDELPGQLGRRLQLHTGIASGLLLVGRSTGPEGVYSVTGTALVTASRLERLAQPREILLAPETQHAVASYFQTEPLRPVVPAGRDVEIVPYRAVGPTRVEDRFRESRLRGLTPYVGREAEMEQLAEALATAAQGNGRLVTVTGEAGLGKSRLLHEFRHGPGLERFSVLQGACRPHVRKIPYQPFLDILRQGLRLRMSERPERVAERLARQVEAIGPDLVAYVPHYLHLLSIQDPRWPLRPGLQGEVLRRELERALGAIITLNLGHRPMVILMEDWHWCDEASDAVMRDLAGVIAEYPLLVVVSHRPEFEPKWGRLSHHRSIRLEPLGEALTERVVLAALRAKTAAPELLERIRARTEGNPLYIEELCRSLRERGAVTMRDGRAELEGAPGPMELPDSVQAIIRSRLDRLPAAARRVLDAAAAIGEEFSGPVLGRVLEGNQDLSPALEDLCAQDLVQQVRVFPEEQYRFNHAITHDVVYEALPLRVRERLHERVGAAIEALHEARLEEHYEALAHQYASSTNRSKALEYLERAGDKAARMYSQQEARQHFRSAVQLLDTASSSPADLRRRCELTLKWSQVSFYVPSEAMTQALERALDEARELADSALEARVTFWRGRDSYAQGMHAQAVERLRHCRQMPGADAVLKALATNYMGRSLTCMARYPESAEALTSSVAPLERAGEGAEVLNSMSLLVLNYGLTGQFQRIPPLAERAFAVADALGNPDIKAVGLLHQGFAGLLQGNWESARDSLREATRLAGAMANQTLNGLAVWGIGYAEVHLGEMDIGIETMQEGIAIVESYQSRLGLSQLYSRLGEVFARLGRVKPARELARAALEISLQGEQFGDDTAHCALAFAAAHGRKPDWGQVGTHMEKSLEISRATGARSRLALSLYHYAELLAEHGDAGRAQVCLKEARALFKAMDMTWYNRHAAKLQSALRRA